MKANWKFVQIKQQKQGGVIADGSQILEGEVISVGTEVKDIKKGDRVVFDSYKSIKHGIKGQEYWFTNHETIFCIL